MRKQIRKIIVFGSFCLLLGSAYAGVSIHHADMATVPAQDPKKKKAGEECKATNECQRHHTCEKSGERSVCTAPPPVQIPNT